MQDGISAGVFFYVIAWLVFANFDFNGGDTIVAYQLQPTVLSEGHFPEMITRSPITYRISGQTVVSQIGDFEPMRYADCAVIDSENWTCTYDDKSGKFGFLGGDYYRKPPSTIGGKSQSVSRFGYVWNRVKWNLASESWIQKATVLFIPFFV